jgi:phosphate transport system protein
MAERHEYRKRFDEQLAEIDDKVNRLFTLVAEAVDRTTGALLTNDGVAAQQTADQDDAIDRLAADIEDQVEREFMKHAPMARDLRYLLSVMRIAPELERSGDLAGHIAHRAIAGLTPRLTPPVQGLLRDMGSTAVEMWQAAAVAWAGRDVAAAARIDAIDDRLDLLHDRLSAALLDGGLERDDALQATLVGRFYERLGDHAVHITERIGYLAGV